MPEEKPERGVLAFGKRLRKLRMRRGFTQRELAKLCSLTPGQVSHYEAGRHRPHARNLARLAQALHVPEQTLAGRQAKGRPHRGRVPRCIR
jgi:transcriptional regulator with XRE-family HTH domain